jgi:hypothetical protein
VDARDVIEGLVILGEQTQAAPLYPLARELIGTGAVALCEIFRFTQTIAGLSRVSPRQRHVSGKPLKTIFRSRCSSRVLSLLPRTSGDTPLPRNDADRSRRVDLGLEIRLPRS